MITFNLKVRGSRISDIWDIKFNKEVLRKALKSLKIES